MRKACCWFRDHQWEQVSIKDIVWLSGTNLQCLMEPDPKGDFNRCKKCGDIVQVQI